MAMNSRLTAVAVAATMATLSLVARPASAAPKFRRVAGKIATYDPSEVKVSGNGRYVAWVARPQPLPAGSYYNSGAHDWPTQVYLLDLVTGRQEVVSHAPGGQPGDADSMSPSFSDDGRYVVFASDATNLVARDTNKERDVFLCDRASGRVTRLSVDRTGAEVYAPAAGEVAGDYPTISGDGSTVAFLSDGNVTRDPHYAGVPSDVSYRGIFVRRVRDGRVTAVTDVKGSVARGPSFDATSWDGDRRDNRGGAGSTMSRPALNRNGTVVAFAMGNPHDSSNPNYADFGVPEPHTNDVFVRNVATGKTVVASVETVTGATSLTSFTHTQVALDAAGTHCLYTVHVYDVLSNVLERSSVFSYDVAAKTARQVSPESPGTYSGEGALSADGRTVAFSSGLGRRAIGWAPVSLDSAAQLFRGALSGTAAAVWSATGANSDTFRSPSLSANGGVLAFISSASLTADDPSTGNGPTPEREDVYVFA